MCINNIIENLKNHLPDIAGNIIEKNNNLPDYIKQNFLSNIDSREHHQTSWHQWGIISHTLKFLSNMEDGTLYDYMDEQNTEKIRRKLNENINQFHKYDLLKVVALLHDIGKFNKSLIFEGNSIAPNKYNFDFHERMSFDFILFSNIRDTLEIEYGFNQEQIEYIAKCAGYHYELGILRKMLKPNYKIAEVNNADQKILTIINSHSEFKYEIGLLFFYDSMAKTDIIIEDNNHNIVCNDDILEKLYQKNYHSKVTELDVRLEKAVKQLPVNIALVQKYFGLL